MADFMHELPLSWRSGRDESDVTSDWRDAVAEVIDVAATQLELAEIGDTTREWLATDFLRSASTRRLALSDDDATSAVAVEGGAHAVGDADANAVDQAEGVDAGGSLTGPSPADRLRAAAVAARTSRSSVPVRVLSRVVAAYLTLAREIAATPALAHRTSGAVALYLAAKAPTPIRAVTRGHTLRARDAEWEFGRGPVLEDDAVPMLEFLLGRSMRAPRPARPSPPGTSDH